MDSNEMDKNMNETGEAPKDENGTQMDKQAQDDAWFEQLLESVGQKDKPNRANADSKPKEDSLLYINRVLPDPDEADFWEEVEQVKSHRFSKRVLWIITVAVVILLILSYTIALQHGKGWFTSLFKSDETIEFTLPIAETPELDDKYQNKDGSYTAAGIAKAVLPSVVELKVYTEDAVIPSSQGSGIILSEDGYIVTNAHVIDGADFGITVVLYDETEYAATIVGSDSSTDIAVIKIGADGLTPAQFADSDLCELGDEVVTVGSPAGYTNSVTKGIISGLDRLIRAENSATAMNCIQIDAAINPGNSGGALFNMYGQVIGITSSKLMSTSYDNMGFAITTNSAKPIIEELMENGYIPDRGRVGITYYAITEDSAEIYGLVAGLYVVTIDEECNVAQTELQEGDIITEMNGVATSDSNQVTEIMNELKAGDTMTCKVYRLNEDGSYEEFEITFELNSDKTAMIEAEESDEEDSQDE